MWDRRRFDFSIVHWKSYVLISIIIKGNYKQKFKLEMSYEEEALLAWLSKVVERQIDKVQDLRTSLHFYLACEKIDQFGPLTFSQQEGSSQWQKNYLNLKNLFEELKNYFDKVINRPFPLRMGLVNVFDIAKGQDSENEGLLALLTSFFFACIGSNNKDVFIERIMDLQQHQQESLMRLLQEDNEKQEIKVENKIQVPYDQVQQKNKRIECLELNLQSVCAENESLQHQLAQQIKEEKKLQEVVKKMEDEMRKVKRELQEKSVYIEQKEQQEMQEQTSQQMISSSNEQLIVVLKNELLSQQKKYRSEVIEFKDQVETLKEQLQMALSKNIELEETGFSVQTKKTEHKQCISKVQHKNLTYDLQLKVNNGEKKNWELQKKIIELESEVREQERKINKLKKEKQKWQSEDSSQKMNGSSGQYVSTKTAKEMKLTFLQALKSDLEKRCAVKGK